MQLQVVKAGVRLIKCDILAKWNSLLLKTYIVCYHYRDASAGRIGGGEYDLYPDCLALFNETCCMMVKSLYDPGWKAIRETDRIHFAHIQRDIERVTKTATPVSDWFRCVMKESEDMENMYLMQQACKSDRRHCRLEARKESPEFFDFAKRFSVMPRIWLRAAKKWCDQLIYRTLDVASRVNPAIINHILYSQYVHPSKPLDT